MRLIFLGASSALAADPGNFQSNMLLQSDQGPLLLIDCGSDARRSLHALNFGHHDITDVYISHLHADHAGGLEWLAFSRKFDAHHLPKPHLYLHESLVKPLWEHTLSGGLASLDDEPASLSAYFQVHPLKEKFQWEGIDFQLIKNRHVFSRYADMPSFGLFFHARKKRILITNDGQFQPNFLNDYYETADLIFQDCETSEVISGVHAHYQQLKTLDPKIKAKMWLYHYNPSTLPNAKADGFAGFAQPAQHFDL